MQGGLDLENTMFAVRGELDGGKNTQDFSNIRQFIGLLIDKEEFLFPIETINEIIMMAPITLVPRAPKYVEGVINLRGNILPAIDLRRMMGIPSSPATAQCRIIVARCENVTVGLIVDGITYVVGLTPDQIQVQSLHSKGTGTELIGMISKRGNQVNGVLDIAKILAETGIAYQTQEAEEDEAA